MLADDEGIVIDSLKYIIEKEFGNDCIVEYAKTGRSVIELAEAFRPDIAIMDIQMPGINGIDAMKEIRENNQKVIFIVMSAYDKFDYAKEAIKIGVTEYISKPMERKKIVASIRQAMQIVDAEKEKRSNDLLVKEKLETVVPIIESGFIYSILLQEQNKEEINNYKMLLDIHTEYGYILSVMCGEQREGNHMTNAVGSSVRMQKYYTDIRNIVKEYLPCVMGNVMSNKLVVLVPTKQESFDYNERITLIDRVRELVRVLRKKTDIDIRIGIGGIKVFHELKDSYQESLNALNATNTSVAHADELPVRCEYADNYPIHMEKKLFAKVENGELEEALLVGNAFYDWMVENHPENKMDIRLKVLEFVLWSEHIAYEAGGMVYQLDLRTDYLPTIMRCDDYEVLRKWFLDKIEIACRNIISKRNEKSNDVVDSAKEYIKANYSKDISLDDVSRQVDISPYYFSKLFKDTTGEGFIEYLTMIRMEKAKELLGNAEYSMKEICAMVGYADPNYFSRTFKKNVGVTPTEYKEGKFQ